MWGDCRLPSRGPSDAILTSSEEPTHVDVPRGPAGPAGRLRQPRLADRLDETLRHDAFTDRDSAFIGEQSFFFLATADADGRPDCSFKGGPPGFARVIAPDTLIFPDYDGNGMFRSLGNLTANPNVGLLFLSVGERPQRLRVNGTAQVLADDPLLAQIPGAQLLIR
uniref:Pyridoxamine 5'-phosphate oxidase family protein n=1 Tax=Phenylobacterium glaciei TaxID=2803784 RepID=A0A974S7W5_9CAUL|nr:pyridoxamine 5'-phosphate oxidase family protein [Phenylobacterium glaciei]